MLRKDVILRLHSYNAELYKAMKGQRVLIAHPNTSQEFKVIKAFFEALQIKFEIAQESPYNPEFVEKIKKGEEQIAEGKGIKTTVANFKDLCR